MSKVHFKSLFSLLSAIQFQILVCSFHYKVKDIRFRSCLKHLFFLGNLRLDKADIITATLSKLQGDKQRKKILNAAPVNKDYVKSEERRAVAEIQNFEGKDWGVFNVPIALSHIIHYEDHWGLRPSTYGSVLSARMSISRPAADHGSSSNVSHCIG